jgi:hypothetical protein
MLSYFFQNQRASCLEWTQQALHALAASKCVYFMLTCMAIHSCCKVICRTEKKYVSLRYEKTWSITNCYSILTFKKINWSLTLKPPSGGIYGSQFLVVKLHEVHKCYWHETSIYSSSFICSFMIYLLNFLKTTLSNCIFIWNVQNSESVSSIYPRGGRTKCLISRKLWKRWITSKLVGQFTANFRTTTPSPLPNRSPPPPLNPPSSDSLRHLAYCTNSSGLSSHVTFSANSSGFQHEQSFVLKNSSLIIFMFVLYSAEKKFSAQNISYNRFFLFQSN